MPGAVANPPAPAPVHELVCTLLAVVAVKVALTAWTDLESKPCASAMPPRASVATAVTAMTALRMLTSIGRLWDRPYGGNIPRARRAVPYGAVKVL